MGFEQPKYQRKELELPDQERIPANDNMPSNVIEGPWQKSEQLPKLPETEPQPETDLTTPEIAEEERLRAIEDARQQVAEAYEEATPDTGSSDGFNSEGQPYSEAYTEYKPCEACKGKGHRLFFFSCRVCEGLGSVPVKTTRKRGIM